tara:strand:- start:4308 stop:4802 length:495 start_codon:yes stop_codon:yes gene_type:complete
MSSGVMIALRPVICEDIGLRIQKIIKDEYHKEFRQELLESVYGFVVRNCDIKYELLRNYHPSNFGKNSYFDWINYRNMCFPNEIGCVCCIRGYPKIDCNKKWSISQDCICKKKYISPELIVYWPINTNCTCDAPYRRKKLIPNINIDHDIESQDYEFFQKKLLE